MHFISECASDGFWWTIKWFFYSFWQITDGQVQAAQLIHELRWLKYFLSAMTIIEKILGRHSVCGRTRHWICLIRFSLAFKFFLHLHIFTILYYVFFTILEAVNQSVSEWTQTRKNSNFRWKMLMAINKFFWCKCIDFTGRWFKLMSYRK